MPALVSRKRSLTIRQRLTPARQFSTTILALEKILLITLSATLNSLPLVFFWLLAQNAFRLIALKSAIFVECSIDRINYRRLFCRPTVVLFAIYCGTQIDHSPGVFVDQDQVLIAVSLLLAAILFSLFYWVRRALESSFCAINGEMGSAFCAFKIAGNAGGVALRLHADG